MSTENQSKTTAKAAILPIWVIDRIKEEMRLNPAAWQAITDAVEKAAVPNTLPCEVKLPPGTVIGQGTPLSTLLMAIAQRASQPAHAQVFNSDPAADQHQGEPVAYQIRSKTDRPESQWTPWKECCETTRAMHSHEVGQFNKFGIMREIRPVYTHADPGEVERLKSIERSYGLREALLEQVKGERDRMIARTLELADQLANQDALLHKLKETLQREYWDEYAGLDETRELIDAALAASAEPEATS